MTLLSGYIFRQVWITALALTFGLALLVLLTQSLRFLDLMITAGAAPWVFFWLLALSLPRLVEIVLPIGIGIGVILVALRLHADQELTVMQAMGTSPARIAKPVLTAAFLSSILLGALSFWMTPTSIATLQAQRQNIQAQFSLSLLQPGVFNFFGDDIMVYFDRRDGQGRLINLILHDQREPARAYTLMAETGELVSDGEIYNLSITNGRRQQHDEDRANVDQLTFTRYQIDLPKTIRDIAPRWKEPDERTVEELWVSAKSTDPSDIKNAPALRAELHRRLATPFLPFSMALPVLWLILNRARPRRGSMQIAALGIAMIGGVQAAFLVMAATAEDYPFLIPALYIVSVLPGFWAMSRLAQQCNEALTRPPGAMVAA